MTTRAKLFRALASDLLELKGKIRGSNAAVMIAVEHFTGKANTFNEHYGAARANASIIGMFEDERASDDRDAHIMVEMAWQLARAAKNRILSAQTEEDRKSVDLLIDSAVKGLSRAAEKLSAEKF